MTDNNKFLEDMLNYTFESTQIVNGVVAEIRKRVDIIGNLKLEIYPNEHTPAHFHVKGDNINASFRIDNCELINGNISNNDVKKVQYWHQKHKNKIINCWNEMRPSDCLVGVINDR